MCARGERMMASLDLEEALVLVEAQRELGGVPDEGVARVYACWCGGHCTLASWSTLVTSSLRRVVVIRQQPLLLPSPPLQVSPARTAAV